ncbi:hypothetical protein H5410_042195 [Solanum commersonii]|uniref:Uncharacterized protein n=1 Tax=Solanum commersonii TaxID=4109 RepID=A0A9J5XU22_SOLCO|nr:hypothetical protein H5410_042195 [Solanum commersonii]
MGKSAHFKGQTDLIAAKPPVLSIVRVLYSMDTFVNTLAMESIGLDGQTDHFKGQMSPKPDLSYEASRSGQANRPIFKIFGYSEFQHDFCLKFSWTFVKTLVIEPVGLDGQTNSFSKSNDPQSRQTGPFPRSKEPRAAGWSRWANRSIYKVKRSLEQVNTHFTDFLCAIVHKFSVIQNFDMNFVEFFHGRPLRSSSLSKLVLTRKSAHFQGQTSPRAVHEFLVIQNFDVIFADIFHGFLLRP